MQNKNKFREEKEAFFSVKETQMYIIFDDQIHLSEN